MLNVCVVGVGQCDCRKCKDSHVSVHWKLTVSMESNEGTNSLHLQPLDRLSCLRYYHITGKTYSKINSLSSVK